MLVDVERVGVLAADEVCEGAVAHCAVTSVGLYHEHSTGEHGRDYVSIGSCEFGGVVLRLTGSHWPYICCCTVYGGYLFTVAVRLATHRYQRAKWGLEPGVPEWSVPKYSLAGGDLMMRGGLADV